jgi:hypothetical protein
MANAYDTIASQNISSDNKASSIGNNSGSRSGYSPPTPQNNSASGSGQLPHPFDQTGNNQIIPSGVYYHIIPKSDGPASKHPGIPGTGFWFPVSGDHPIDFTFTHEWDRADNLAKKLISSVARGIGNTLAGAGGAEALDFLARQGQHTLQGSLYFSGCAIYNSSAPPSISINTRLFATGNGNLIKIIEMLRYDTHGRLNEGDVSAAVASATNSQDIGNKVQEIQKAGGVKSGRIEHPGWWDVEIISGAGGGGNQVVAKMNDMFCVGMKVDMYSPWIGQEPSFMELSLSFQHGFPGVA